MKTGNAQFIVLTELTVLLLLESNILNKLITLSRLAFTGNAAIPVTSSSAVNTTQGIQVAPGFGSPNASMLNH